MELNQYRYINHENSMLYSSCPAAIFIYSDIKMCDLAFIYGIVAKSFVRTYSREVYAFICPIFLHLSSACDITICYQYFCALFVCSYHCASLCVKKGFKHFVPTLYIEMMVVWWSLFQAYPSDVFNKRWERHSVGV